MLAPSSPVKSCYVRVYGRGLYVFSLLEDLLLSPLSFTSQVLEVFGSSQNVCFKEMPLVLSWLKPLLLKQWDLSDASKQASWGRDCMCERPECRLEAVAIQMVE